MEILDQLINNSRTRLSEEDREWLAVLHEEQLERMLPVEDDADAPTTLEEFVASAPEEFKGTLESALNQRNENRKNWVANIMAHPANKFTEAQLQAKPCTELVALNEMLAFKPEAPAPAPAPAANEGLKAPSFADYGFAAPAGPAVNTDGGIAPLSAPSLDQYK